MSHGAQCQFAGSCLHGDGQFRTLHGYHRRISAGVSHVTPNCSRPLFGNANSFMRQSFIDP
jgi:hypothetical protein